MGPFLSERSHSMFRQQLLCIVQQQFFCRYAGSTTSFVHVLGPHLSGFVGALLSLHYSSIAAPAPSQATCTNPALLPPSSSKSIFTGANYGFLPPSSSIGVVPNCGKSPLCSGCFAIRRGLYRCSARRIAR